MSGRCGVLGFLDFIAAYESRGNYNAFYGDAENRDDPEFTAMTVGEVLEWQDARRFSACGKYQIIRKTLLSLQSEMVLTGARYSAAEALEMGLLQRLTTPSDLDRVVETWLEHVLESGPLAVRSQKALLAKWESLPLDEAISEGITHFAAAYESDEPKSMMARRLKQ